VSLLDSKLLMDWQGEANEAKLAASGFYCSFLFIIAVCLVTDYGSSCGLCFFFSKEISM